MIFLRGDGHFLPFVSKKLIGGGGDARAGDTPQINIVNLY